MDLQMSMGVNVKTVRNRLLHGANLGIFRNILFFYRKEWSNTLPLSLTAMDGPRLSGSMSIEHEALAVFVR